MTPQPAKTSRDQRYATPYARRLGKSRQIQQQVGVDRRSRPYDEPYEIPEYVEGQRYSKTELTLMAEEMLRKQAANELPAREEPAILLWHMYKDRLRREIYVGTGIPDPSIESGIYWRTHPQGRKVNSEERRDRGACFYR